MNHRDRQRVSDILAAIDAIRSHLQRGDLTDGLVFDAVRIRHPDVVLMDIRMPRVDGLVATRRLRARLARLTEREHEVAVAVGRGLSNAEIGAELHLGLATVKAHVSRLLTKLDLNNRVQIALLVHDAELV